MVRTSTITPDTAKVAKVNGLVGPSSKQRSVPFNAERSINCFPVMDKHGKEVQSLYGTPGLSLFSTGGIGPVRGCFYSTNGRAFYVSSNSLYEVTSAGISTIVGTLTTATNTIVEMEENGFQLAICDGLKLYIFTYATNAFVKVTDPDLPSAATLTFIDGYFVVSQVNAGTFYISALYDGTSWAALQFATAESSPDNLVRVLNAAGGSLWLLGSKTGEIWQNTGQSPFPFTRISGAKMEVGILAANTAIAIDNTIFWVGQDNIGSGIVFRAQGFTPSRISTNAIELLIQAAPTPSTLRAFTYQQEGHVFYVITGGGMDTTLVYDISTQMWHERAYLNAVGQFELHLASCGMYAFNKFIVGDRTNGNIYVMSQDVFTDNGREIAMERTFTHLSDQNQRIIFSDLTIGVEVGDGLQSGQGSDPLITLYLSRDGGRSWSGGKQGSIGRVGQYRIRSIFRRLGQARIMTFRIRISDPIKRAITGCYLNVGD